MIGKNSSEEKIFNECAKDTAMLMAALSKKYRHHSGTLAQALAASLGNFVVIFCKDPQPVFDRIYQQFKEIDVQATKTGYFGYMIGVDTSDDRGSQKSTEENGRDSGASKDDAGSGETSAS